MKQTSDSYLYQVADYNKEIFNYLMRADRIDKNSEAFAEIAYDVKMRQVSSVILKVLMNNRVELLIDTKGMSRAFKVIYCKDVKSKNKDERKVFIDCTGLIEYKNGAYKCKDIGKLLSYLITGMTYVIYYVRPEVILKDSTLVQSSTEAFVDLMLYVLGYLKLPITYADNKEKMSFALAEYFLECVMQRDSSSNIDVARKISGVNDRVANYMHVLFADTIDEGKGNIKDFILKFAEVFLGQSSEESKAPKNRTILNADVLSQRWMYAFGAGTFLGLELFVPFSAILTDCYVGSYINQQNTVEKIAGKNVVIFTNELLKIGSENA